jgi:hypothetical protein
MEKGINLNEFEVKSKVTWSWINLNSFRKFKRPDFGTPRPWEPQPKQRNLSGKGKKAYNEE